MMTYSECDQQKENEKLSDIDEEQAQVLKYFFSSVFTQ